MTQAEQNLFVSLLIFAHFEREIRRGMLRVMTAEQVRQCTDIATDIMATCSRDQVGEDIGRLLLKLLAKC